MIIITIKPLCVITFTRGTHLPQATSNPKTRSKSPVLVTCYKQAPLVSNYDHINFGVIDLYHFPLFLAFYKQPLDSWSDLH